MYRQNIWSSLLGFPPISSMTSSFFSESAEQSETVEFLYSGVCADLYVFNVSFTRVWETSQLHFTAKPKAEWQANDVSDRKERHFWFSYTVPDRAKKKHQRGSLKETCLLPVSFKISSDANHMPLGVGAHGALAAYEWRPHCYHSMWLCVISKGTCFQQMACLWLQNKSKHFI